LPIEESALLITRSFTFLCTECPITVETADRCEKVVAKVTVASSNENEDFDNQASLFEKELEEALQSSQKLQNAIDGVNPDSPVWIIEKSTENDIDSNTSPSEREISLDYRVGVEPSTESNVYRDDLEESLEVLAKSLAMDYDHIDVEDSMIDNFEEEGA